jgi:hypothetical protein
MRWVLVPVLVSGLAWSGAAADGKEPDAQTGIPPETVADYIHAVIEADRIVYTLHVVERMQSKGVVSASENWRTTKTLPLPAQFLKESSDLATMTGTNMRYRLIGLWPINKQNVPTTDFERVGLEDVLLHPERPYRGIVTVGTQRMHQSIYADRAFAQSCIGCHNAHPDSPRHDFKINDVMGAVVITIPLGP